MENQLELELELDDYHKVKALYDDYTGNHPVIHCNRFASWEELEDYNRVWWTNFLKTTPKKYWYD